MQVSRLGMPLVNEVVIPLGQKDRFNASEPRDDAQFGSFVLDPEPARLIPVLYPGVKVPPAPRNDLAAIFLTGIRGLNKPANVVPSEMIRLNMAIRAVGITRTASACSPARTTASRTAAASATTSSTSSCGRWPAARRSRPLQHVAEQRPDRRRRRATTSRS